MSEWCQNRFEITGKSVCIDVMLQWINGTEMPRYRHAVQQSMQLFLAGCAGILKPVRSTSCPMYQGLVRNGTGLATPQNTAYEQWLDMLQKDAVLDPDNVRIIDRLYHQSGLSALKWESIPQNARETMTSLVKRQYVDWFGLASLTDEPDMPWCWERLREYPERAQPCDMLMIIPTRIATELNGSGGLFSGGSTTTSLYSRVYGMEWPAGHAVSWSQTTPNCLSMSLDTPWYPPSGEVVSALSALFECEIRHSYNEPVSGLAGYDCYDQGDHVDGHKGLPTEALQPLIYLVSEQSQITEYRDVRG